MKLKQLMDFEMDKNKKSSLQVKAVKALAGFLILMFLLTILSRAADSLTIAKVTASAATGGVISHNIEVDGNITPNKDIAISTSANIKIASVEATEGKTVKKGDLLIQLDTADLKKKLLQAQKELQRQQPLTRKRMKPLRQIRNQKAFREPMKIIIRRWRMPMTVFQKPNLI